MTVENRAPGVVWGMRREGGGYVRTMPDEEIEVVVPRTPGKPEQGLRHVWLTRDDARLLAKRLNQCLTATAKR